MPGVAALEARTTIYWRPNPVPPYFGLLRHIVELRPQVVKIDRSLVAGIDADPARQVLLAGLRYFANARGCRLVAEGIETEAELSTLVGLNIHAGQGFLLGKPAPVAELAESAAETETRI